MIIWTTHFTKKTQNINGKFELDLKYLVITLFLHVKGKGKTANQILCANDNVTYAIVAVVLHGSALFCSVTLLKASKLTSGLTLPVSERSLSLNVSPKYCKCLLVPFLT